MPHVHARPTQDAVITRSRIRAALTAGLAAALFGASALEAQQVASPEPELATRPSPGVAYRPPGRGRLEIDAAGRRYAAVVRHCYQERGLKEDPSLRGLLRVALTVLPSGGVRATAATATRVHGLGMPAVTACVATAARSWRFTDGSARAERVELWFDLLPEV